ncbi:MAG: outer membrane beta-barrel protein [Verrucomicrobia bacterium]|jgi:hypothetical protein|nr:outer membrane beta-barrel protein [Verrucomicrobiota bacterium]
MKNKIAIASAFLAASSFSTAEIVVNDFLSFEGFVDMSYTHSDTDSDVAALDGSDNSFSIDQVEISWLFDFDPVTAQIDLEHEEGRAIDNDSGTAVEQAFATYHLDGGSAITAGRYASMLGFEAFEPTGLYQYSFAYDMGFGDLIGTPGYVDGVKYTYESDDSFFGISVHDTTFNSDEGRLGGSGNSTYGIEAAGSMILGDGLNWFVGGAYEDGDAAIDSDAYVFNTYLTYETGAWVFAGELIYGEYEAGQALVDGGFGTGEEEVLQALLMANFAYSDAASITGRISYSDHELDDAGSTEADFAKFTLAHGYAFTDNLFLVNEISYVDGDVNGGDYENLLGAVELIFSF